MNTTANKTTLTNQPNSTTTPKTTPTKHSKITALYERLSIGDERQRGGSGEDSNSIKHQKEQLEAYAKQNGFVNIKHYTDDDESGRFFDRDGYQQMIEDIESGKIGVVIMKDLTRWGRSHVQVGSAMEFFRQHNVRFIAVNNSIDSDNPESLEFTNPHRRGIGCNGGNRARMFMLMCIIQ